MIVGASAADRQTASTATMARPGMENIPGGS